MNCRVPLSLRLLQLNISTKSNNPLISERAKYYFIFKIVCLKLNDLTTKKVDLETGAPFIVGSLYAIKQLSFGGSIHVLE